VASREIRLRLVFIVGRGRVVGNRIWSISWEIRSEG
jgi:hypothetical protein